MPVESNLKSYTTTVSLTLPFGKRFDRVLYRREHQRYAIKTTSQRIAIEFQRSSGEHNEQLTVDESSIKALLSLWTYSSRKARGREIAQTQAIKRRNRSPQSAPNRTYFYLLGKNCEDCIYMRKCLQRIAMALPGSRGPNWVSVTLPKLEMTPPVRTRWDTVCRCGFLIGFELTTRNTETEPLIVAFQCEARFQNNDADAVTLTCGPSQFLGNPYRFPQSPAEEAMEAIRQVRTGENTKNTYLAYQYPLDRSIEIVHAQHMFSIFIRQVSKLIEGGGEQERRVSALDMKCIAKIFEECGLGPEQEAYICVVPELVMGGVLLD